MYRVRTNSPRRFFLLSRSGGGYSQVKRDITLSQPESRLQRKIQKALKDECGPDLFIFKIHGGPMMMSGLPDLIGVFQGQMFGLEVKMPTGTVSTIQEHVHARMRRAGVLIGVPRSVAEALAYIDRWFPREGDE